MRKKFISDSVNRKLSYTCVLNFVVFASCCFQAALPHR